MLPVCASLCLLPSSVLYLFSFVSDPDQLAPVLVLVDRPDLYTFSRPVVYVRFFLLLFLLCSGPVPLWNCRAVVLLLNLWQLSGLLLL